MIATTVATQNSTSLRSRCPSVLRWPCLEHMKTTCAYPQPCTHALTKWTHNPKHRPRVSQKQAFRRAAGQPVAHLQPDTGADTTGHTSSHKLPSPCSPPLPDTNSHQFLPRVYQVTQEHEPTHLPSWQHLFLARTRSGPVSGSLHSHRHAPASLTGVRPDGLANSRTPTPKASPWHTHVRPAGSSKPPHNSTQRRALRVPPSAARCWARTASLSPARWRPPPALPAALAPSSRPSASRALTRCQAPAPAETGSAPNGSVGTTWWLRRELAAAGARGPAEREPPAPARGGRIPGPRPDHRGA